MLTPARLLIPMLLAAALAVPSAATASGDEVLQDCLAGHLKAHYPAADYASALANMPADAAEYTPCIGQITAARDRDLAQTARGLAAGNGGAGATTGTSGTGVLRSGTAKPGPGSNAPPSTSPLHATTPRQDGTTGIDPNTGLALLAAGPGDDDPGAGSGNGLPAIPIVLAFSVIALSAARALKWWGDRPEGQADDAVAPTA